MSDINNNVLVIAGFDNSGGAGIICDVKTISKLNSYSAVVITNIAIQDSNKIHKIITLSTEDIKKQIITNIKEFNINVIKIGMIYSIEILNLLVEMLPKYNIPIIIDPIIKSTSGGDLYQSNYIKNMIIELFPICLLITPNIYELEILTDSKIYNINDAIDSANILINKGAQNILVKCTDLYDDKIVNILVNKSGYHIFEIDKIDKKYNIRGTGCSLSSAIASNLNINDLDNTINKSMNFLSIEVDKAIKLSSNNFFFV